MSTTLGRIGRAGEISGQPCGYSRSWHNWLNLIRLPVHALQNDWSRNKRPCPYIFLAARVRLNCDIRDYQD